MNSKKSKKSSIFNRYIFAVIAIVIMICEIIALIKLNVKDNIQNDKNIANKNEKSVSIATINIKDYGTIKLELSYKDAPNTVKNFIALANNGFYDNLTFHRIVKDFMIQGGDKNGDGTGNATLSAINKEIMQGTSEDKEYSIKGEFSKNGITNNITFEKGVIAMARLDYSFISEEVEQEGYNSASSQFFITTKDNTTLNGEYAGFGKVIDGMEILDELNNVQVDENNDKPITPVIITSITVDTNNTDYGLPTTQDVFDIKSYLLDMYSLENYKTNNSQSTKTNANKNETKTNTNTNNDGKTKKTVHYTVTAIKGCVITYSNPETGEFSYKGKCEKCGKVESTGHTRYDAKGINSTFNSGYYCPNCKETQKIEILYNETEV